MTEGLQDPAFLTMMMTLFLVYCRVQACFISMPAFSQKVLPARVRVALAMAVTPLLAQQDGLRQLPAGLATLGMLVAAELVTGLVLGALVRLMAGALDIAASTIAASASLSQLIGATTEYAPHPIGNLLHLAGLALLMAMGFPVLLCELLRDSFQLRPLGDWPQIAELLPNVVGIISRAFLLAMLLAAPFILGGFLFQLLTGMVSKVMPSLPIVFIAAPAAILLALLGITLLTPSILSVWAEALLTLVEDGPA